VEEILKHIYIYTYISLKGCLTLSLILVKHWKHDGIGQSDQKQI